MTGSTACITGSSCGTGTNAHVKGDASMTELTITARNSGKKPDSRKTAAELLERCRAFYQDPENEKAFQEWMKERKSR